MKSVRKGFTLVEMLIVITIIGLLGTMMLISGTDAQNAAKAVKITEGFRNLTAAFLEYNDVEAKEAAEAIGLGTSGVKTIIAGMKKYIKNDEVLDEVEGCYYVKIKGSTVWLVYYLPNTTGAINDLLAKKAKDYGLKKASNADPKVEKNDYDGKQQEVYVNVF